MDEEPMAEALAKIDRALWGEAELFDGLVILVGRLQDDVGKISDKLRAMDSAREHARHVADRRVNVMIGVVPLVTAILTALLTAWLT